MTATATATHTLTITIARTALRAALAKLAGAVGGTAKALPVAQHIRIEAGEGRLTLTATDFDAFVRLSLSCEVDGEGVTLVPAKRLTEIVAALPPTGAVTVQIQKHKAVVSAGRSVFELVTMDPVEFPATPEITGDDQLTVEAAPFLDAITRGVLHASDEESRPALNAVQLEPHGDRLIVTAIHGSRMARLPAGSVRGVGAACSLHRMAVPLLARLFAGLPDDATLVIAIDEYRIRIDGPDASAVVRRVSDKFPPYQHLFATEPTRIIECDRLLLSAAVKRVALVSGPARRIAFSVGAELELRASEAGEGTAADVVTIDARTGDPDPLRIGLNASFVSLALDTLTAPSVVIATRAPEHPVLFRAAGQDPADPTVVLLMPLILRD